MGSCVCAGGEKCGVHNSFLLVFGRPALQHCQPCKVDCNENLRTMRNKMTNPILVCMFSAFNFQKNRQLHTLLCLPK